MFIEFENIINARELGGMRAADGRRVAGKNLFRTAGLYYASESDRKRLSEELGIAQIFDFRDAHETELRPDCEVRGAVRHFLPVLPKLPTDDKTDYDALPPEGVTAFFLRMYRTMAENDVCVNAYKSFFRLLLSGGGAPVLWHCSQGKDRTGIAAILLLTALGVSEKDAVEEYFLSNIPMKREYARLEAEGMDEKHLANMERMIYVYPECLGQYLSAAKEGFGSLDGYLTHRIGLAEDDKALLRSYYTE